MNQIETALENTAAFLKKEIPQADFYTDSREGCEHSPLSRPAGILRLFRLEAGDASLNDCIGLDENGILLGKQAVATVGLSIYSPNSELECRRIFAAAAEALLFSEETICWEMECGEAEYRVREEVFHLSAKAKLSLLLTREKSEQTATRFRLRAEAR